MQRVKGQRSYELMELNTEQEDAAMKDGKRENTLRLK